ncbi:hypothetical protein CH272_28080 [Rhodococcus sp. 05-340-1]|uniref:sulfatase/phosphatase domain-containing protein n=1 Tax=unclassified Rhodococcus (in: high G+C Gram-positive bacteria) TaxID=192944 RepID=UPI000B9B3C90|nr:hypothetical protein CH271_10800 [Rhodococcus sp. 05-340-2]OZD69343.1 hypothetical protein CH272_28080 [Rhodococcus sp. 05-340-1]
MVEGGTRAPLIVKSPGGGETGRMVDTFAHVADLYPTFAEYAGGRVADTDVLIGDSMKPLLDGASQSIGDDRFGTESWGQRTYRDRNLKLVYTAPGYSGTSDWALYDLGADPGETSDLADENPEEVQRLSVMWDRYAKENNVIGVDFATVNGTVAEMVPTFFGMNWAE